MTNAIFKVGMALVLVEGGDQLPALVGQYNKTAPPVRSGATHVGTGSCYYSWVLASLVIGMATIWY